jgi:hypothetical protein
LHLQLTSHLSKLSRKLQGHQTSMGNEQVDKLVDCAIRGAAIGGGEFLALCLHCLHWPAALAGQTLLACSFTLQSTIGPLADPIVCDLALAGFESIRSGKSEPGTEGRGMADLLTWIRALQPRIGTGSAFTVFSSVQKL